jgi:hypothetical protein
MVKKYDAHNRALYPAFTLSFPHHHGAALGTLHLETGHSLLVRRLVAAGRAEAEPSRSRTETAAAASTLAAAALTATLTATWTLTPGKTWHVVSPFYSVELIS